jgi:hypothetical protein
VNRLSVDGVDGVDGVDRVSGVDGVAGVDRVAGSNRVASCVRWVLAIATLAVFGAVTPRVQSEDSDAAKIDFFRKKVEPVLKEHCFECHSRKADEVKGDLLLDSQAALAKGGANGPAVVPGDVDASFLIRAIRYTEDDYKMPPRGKLDDDVIRDLEKWIKDGAKNNLPKESP